MQRRLTFIIVVLAILGFAAGAAAQARVTMPNLKVEIVPAEKVGSLDGAVLYDAYCASCHGRDLKGYGPAWRFTSTPPTDLTVGEPGHLTPDAREQHLIEGIRAGHGSISPASLDGGVGMPDWYAIFAAMSSNNAEQTLRIAAIARYIVAQQKPVK